MTKPRIYTPEEMKIRNRERAKAYIKAHPEQNNKRAKEYYHKNKERLKQDRRDRYYKQKEEINRLRKLQETLAQQGFLKSDHEN